MTTADESRLLNSLYTRTVDSRKSVNAFTVTAMPCTYVSKDLNSVTPGRPYLVVFSIRVFSNKGMWQISSTSG